jgi:hypothetical protein
VEIGCGQRIEQRKRLRQAVERGLACQSTALIGNGDEGGPLGRCRTRAADFLPAGLVVAVINRIAGVWVGVVGHVGSRPRCGALRDDSILVGGLGLERADPAAAAAPAAFTQNIALRIHL